MNFAKIPSSVIRKKALDRIEQYLSISDKQSLSIGFYVNGQAYIIDFGQEEQELSYDIGSVSKTVTGHLILKLCDDGLIDINESVSKYLDIKSGKYPTIYELLTHTDGYGYLTPIEITVPNHLRRRFSYKNPYENVKAADILRALERRNHKRRARKYNYSDFSYAVLALIAEKVTGKKFIDLINNFIKHDLNLDHTVISKQAGSPKSVYKGRIIPCWIWKDNDPYIAAGGLASNIYDMLKYIGTEIESDKKYITDGHIVCPASFSENKRTGTTVCWHTYKNSDQIWHIGAAGTFRSSLIFNKVKHIGVVVLGNTKGVRSANVNYIAKMLYNELKLKKIKFN